ncbi:carbohydrate ABC transporter permease [Paenibacillus radicis (ex Xue et al. 2023)]|uniref:Carbohydrate ABC transporter permease n=1 Tax=Paenibacillus radicis (ex Xue et al. 2023) TaxID=2972489 RepID=A0ABT1YRI3_9BACL|nr:carbohydrate ABC transporter permease [Paenibacillus radicis (ex Xue et al. 2023)]MCR8635782.1 carbohydrate ABC transporter permease [Paenibacillus radicis (ex Xue et al. 2023)]
MSTIVEPTASYSVSKPFRLSVLIRQILLYAVVILVSLSMVVPFIWMLSASVKSESEVFSFPIQWIPSTFYWSNYEKVWFKLPFFSYYLNTIKIAVSTTILQIITCSLAAYAFSKVRFPERDKLFFLYVATMMIPFQVMMIPQFMLMKQLGLLNSHWALILLGAFSPFGVFLFRQFFISIPEELSEAARIDGLSEFGIYLRVIMPLMRPAIASLTIFTFMHSWNDFLGPLIYINSDHLFTLQLGMQHFQSEHATEYGPLMAAAVSAIVPTILIYFFAQDHFVEGIAAGAIKG